MSTAAPTFQMRFGAAVLTLRKLTPIKEFPYFAVLIVRPVRNKKCCLTVSDEAFCYGRGLKINIFYDTDRKPDNGTKVGGIFLRLNALSAFLRVFGSAVNYTASFQNTAQTSSDSATADTVAAIIIFNIFRCSFSIVLSSVSVLFERVSEQFKINCS